jgi:hypothetical protein
MVFSFTIIVGEPFDDQRSLASPEEAAVMVIQQVIKTSKAPAGH